MNIKFGQRSNVFSSSSNQTWHPTMFLAFLAKASATKLPVRCTWMKSKNRKEETKHRISSTMFPYEDNAAFLWETALITIVESPSKMTLWRPSSAANWTAWRQARAFVERENSQLIADTSYYQVQKVQPIIKRHVLLLGFVITIQKPTEICQVSLK